MAKNSSGHSHRNLIGITLGGKSATQKRVENAILIGIPFLGSIACPFWFYHNPFTFIEISAFLIGYIVIGMGVGIGLHRYFSHRSFKTSFWFAGLLGAAGSMACQGSVLRWVIDHRRHHAHTDRPGDTHSPIVDARGEPMARWPGLIHAHIGWMFDPTITQVNVFGRDLKNDRIVMFFHKTHWFWPFMSLAAPFIWGYIFGGIVHAIGCCLFGGCLRTTLFHNVVWSVNSIGHMFGYQTYTGHDSSRNNRILAWAAFGEGWHNNHHRYPRSAVQGFSAHEVDLNGIIIKILERIGVVQGVQRASPLRRESVP